MSEDVIPGMQDRSRQLLAMEIFLAYRLALITIPDTKDEVDGQEDRQLNYYQTLTDVVQSVLQLDISLYQIEANLSQPHTEANQRPEGRR